MPIYEFRCIECGDVFERLFMYSDEKVDLCCPRCTSESIERVVSRSSYAVGASGKGGRSNITTKSCGQGNQCATLDLPGPTK